MDRKFCKAIIEWDMDPSRFPVNVWLQDLIVIFGEIENKIIIGDTWTVLVRINEFIDGTWSTNSDIAFIVNEAPWHMLVKGFSFKLWSGKDIATVTLI